MTLSQSLHTESFCEPPFATTHLKSIGILLVAPLRNVSPVTSCCSYRPAQCECHPHHKASEEKGR